MDLRPLFLGCRHSLLSPTLGTFHKFCCVVVSYHSKYFFIFPLVSSLTHRLFTVVFHFCFPGGSVVKNPPANAGNTSSIPGSGRSPGEGNGNRL